MFLNEGGAEGAGGEHSSGLWGPGPAPSRGGPFRPEAGLSPSRGGPVPRRAATMAPIATLAQMASLDPASMAPMGGHAGGETPLPYPTLPYPTLPYPTLPFSP